VGRLLIKPDLAIQAADVASISTFYDRLGHPDPNQSLAKIKNGKWFGKDGDTSVTSSRTPEDLAQSATKKGIDLVRFTDRSGRTVWVNPQWVTGVRAGAYATVIEQSVDRLPWDPIQVRESVRMAAQQLGLSEVPERNVSLVD
jgi:hypothetical protein